MNRSSMAPQAAGKQRGFTLIELLVCVAIIGILSAIAYPAYGKYLIKSNRGAAQSHLLELALAESQYLADTRSYTDSLTELHASTPAAVSSKYDISFTLGSAPASFIIKATPIMGTNQYGDPVLTIDSAGAKTPADKW